MSKDCATASMIIDVEIAYDDAIDDSDAVKALATLRDYMARRKLSRLDVFAAASLGINLHHALPRKAIH